MFTLLGDAERTKLPVGFTASVSLVWFVNVPDEPVTVKVKVPTAAAAPAVRLSALVLAALLGLNAAVTPLGRPEIEKLTFPVKPFSGVMVMVPVPLPPCIRVTLLGEAESAKFGPKNGQLFTRLAAFTVPMPVAKSQPVEAP